jgi:gamma-aminobutyric acid type B receptor
MVPIRVFFSFLLLLLLAAAREKYKVRLHALIPIETSVWGDESAVPALLMAVDDIRSSSMLSDYEILLDYSDTQCDSATGSYELMNAILQTNPTNETKIVAIIGGGCSQATESTATLTGRLYNMVQVSYAAASPSLSNKLLYPLFFRLWPSESLFNNARLSLNKKYNWCLFATLHKTINIFTLTVQDIQDHYQEVLGNVCNRTSDHSDGHQLYSFTRDPLIPLKQIKASDKYPIIL